MTFNNYASHGRTLMVKFTCHRCGFEKLDPLRDHQNDDPESSGHLDSLKAPEGWKELLHGPLLCPACAKAYNIFMRYIDEETEEAET